MPRGRPWDLAVLDAVSGRGYLGVTTVCYCGRVVLLGLRGGGSRCAVVEGGSLILSRAGVWRASDLSGIIWVALIKEAMVRGVMVRLNTKKKKLYIYVCVYV